MSDKYICSESKLVSIGNAIRNKTSTTSKLTLDSMATAINNISSGVTQPIIEHVTVGSENTNYLTTSVDYSSDARCAFFVYKCDSNINYTRTCISGIRGEGYNTITMLYPSSSESKTYYDTYNYHLAITNVNNKISIYSSTYQFIANATYLVIIWDKSSNVAVSQQPITTREEDQEYKFIINTSIDYKEQINCILITNGDWTTIGNNVGSYGDTVFATSLITTAVKSIAAKKVLYSGETTFSYIYPAIIEPGIYTPTYGMKALSFNNNNGKLSIKCLQNSGTSFSPISVTSKFLVIAW